MKTELFAGTGKTILFFLCIMNLFSLGNPGRARGDGSVSAPAIQSYCHAPFAVTDNLLLMIDNSMSMYDPAYNDPSTYCLDASYDNTKPYSGYFDRNSIYYYDSERAAFVPGATLPSGYLYLGMDGVQPNRTVSSFKASGNFLNWLATSKMDIEKQVLTGGKFELTNNTTGAGVLQGETRGCQGKRFVKIDSQYPGITFAVRGPFSTDPVYALTSRGGATTIEIYDKPYNKVPCLKAIEAWRTKDQEGVIAQTNACQGLAPEVLPPPVSVKPGYDYLFNRVMTDCHFYFAQATIAFYDNNLVNSCVEAAKTPLDMNTVFGICAEGVTHTPRIHNRIANTIGFLGGCLAAGGDVSKCYANETMDFCDELKVPRVLEPSTTVNMPGTSANMQGASANVPGFVLDAGISNLGAVSGAFQARVFVDAAPTGLVQQFSNSINFGAMLFNANGAAGSECASGKLTCVNHCTGDVSIECTQTSDCTINSNGVTQNYGTCEASRDGGKIISYINDPASPLGDHTTGLIAAIDGVKAYAWTPFAESFYNAIGYFSNRADLRLSLEDFDISRPPSKFSCQRNNVLVVSDGMSTADSSTTVAGVVAAYAAKTKSETGSNTAKPCPPLQGSRNLDDLAWIASHRNIKSFSKNSDSQQAPATQAQSISTHVIFTGKSDETAPGECNPDALMRLTAASGGGVYASSSEPGALYGAFKAVLQRIAQGTNSGTDASIFSTGDGNGAIFLQEQYYPRKSFDGGWSSASWIGEMQSLWYYIDPFLGNTPGAGSTIREDSVSDPGFALNLNLKTDKIVSLRFDPGSNRTYAYLRSDPKGDGVGAGAEEGPIDFDAVKSLWRAGKQLWARSASTRTIHTSINGTSLLASGADSFGGFYSDDTRARALRPYLQAAEEESFAEAKKIIEYIRGTDQTNYRNRKVSFTNPPVDPPVDSKEWKLGDIIDSTPRIQSGVKQNDYGARSSSGYGDVSYDKFIGSSSYANRGMVYVGANDGMLHAFRMGKLSVSGDTIGGDVKATLTGDNLGEEQWAYIPRNALPYLKYLTDKDRYKHLYYVDGPTVIADLAIGKPSACALSTDYSDCAKDLDAGTNWKTVLIGSMGLGGASRIRDAGCAEGAEGTCVRTPLYDAADINTLPHLGLGYSSYFALDITDQYFTTGGGLAGQPTLKWEFSHPDLGYATSGAAIVRIASMDGDGAPFKDRNGKWFAVFASGPTGPIDTEARQFLGKSDQNLKLFVVDLGAAAPLVKDVSYWVIDTGIKRAFAGSVTGSGIDTDRWDRNAPGNYQDDALYIGFTKANIADGDPITGSTAWNVGGVIRVLTKEDINPAHWVTSQVVSGTGPVITGIARVQDRANKKLWLYFGTGRYFYPADDVVPAADPANLRHLVGVQDRCYTTANTMDKNCNTLELPGTDPEANGKGGTLGLGDLKDQSTDIDAIGTRKGWYIRLDPQNSATNMRAERSITNPTSSTAGAVFFTTFQPNADPCLPARSYLWGMKYDTGGTIPAGLIQGKVLVPLSSGSPQETGLSEELTDKDKRRGPAMPGKPGGMKLISNSGLRPLKRIIHIQER